MAGITDVATTIGLVYVAVIVDAWSRTVVGNTVGRSIDIGPTLAAFRTALETAKPRLQISGLALPAGRRQERPRRIDRASL